MDGRGGCCIARYAGRGAAVYDISKVDWIMSRFRPIAPKPATGGSVSSGSSPEMSEVSSKSGRGKRRYRSSNNTNGHNINGIKRCHNGCRKRKPLTDEEKVDGGWVVTLPLLPETPDRKDSPARESIIPPKQAKNATTWLSFGDQMVVSGGFGASANRTVVMPRVVGSCVTVECFTDTWVDVDGLGRTDMERRVNLEEDTCPGFISDGFGRVTWTNEAYRKMVSQGGDDDEMVVWLAMKEKVPPVTVLAAQQRAFTCRVRVQYGHNGCNGKEGSSITVPCDVWGMDGGGFAWRLDVKAALCLGR